VSPWGDGGREAAAARASAAAPPVASRAGRSAGAAGPVVPLDATLCDPVPCDPQEASARRVADGLWCLRLPLPYPGTPSVNAYLQGTTLFDCGSAAGAGWAALEHALSLAGARRIDRLVLTHLHPDHAGLAGEVVRRTRCEVVRFRGPDTANDALREVTLSAEARRRTARRVGVPPDELDLMLETPMGGDGRTPRPSADRLLQPGEEIDGWRVVEATGHSPNQMALFDGRTVIAADAAYPEVMPFLEWGYTPDPWAEYAATLDRVEALRARLYLPGHGRPDTNPAGRFASARDVQRRFLDAVRAAQPGNAYEITLKLCGDDPDPNRRQSTLAVVLCALDHLAR
jgi:glyoxylase-like metal-dependent hydrolase (beta-lactamase superfamily II)